ncbi:MAG: phospho-sugar mutase, partial [Coriobacteriia bacterium]|nr:phospho-sugar mutase [Coriobacteriia bacterium]
MANEQVIARWQEKATDPEIAAQLAELLASGDADAIEDAFYRNLEFGTAGLRGVLGAGTNRMNIYTVGQATQGLCDYLNAHKAEGATPSVAICYDSRINSDLFARETAAIAAGNGVKAYIYPRLEPTPALSFAVRHLGCDAGVNVTASHNPAKYNGYKVYGPDGCQIAAEMADEIQATILRTDAFDDVKKADFETALAAGDIEWISDETLEAFLDAVQAQSVTAAGDDAAQLKLVYTPLNGTGLETVTKILNRIGIDDITVVPEQAMPDGNFPTCPYPNPEMLEA